MSTIAAATDAWPFVSPETDVYANLALEEWLFRQLPATAAVLFFYRNDRAVVLGRNQNPWAECDLPFLAHHGIPLARRLSGGGTVYLDPGVLNFCLIAPRHPDAPGRFAECTAAALRACGLSPTITPRRTVELAGHKISGNAFWLTARRALCHGTLLLDADLDLLERCLRSGLAGLAGTAVTSVRSCVGNLVDLAPGLAAADIAAALAAAFAAELGQTPAALGAALRVPDAGDRFFAACRERQRSWDWQFGRTPLFTHTFAAALPAPAPQVTLTVRDGRVTDIAVEGPCCPAGALDVLRACIVGCRYDVPELTAIVERTAGCDPGAAPVLAAFRTGLGHAWNLPA